jgi:acetylornithine deacetylase/succinyl-diaminopimelate desuccinylase-like protein
MTLDWDQIGAETVARLRELVRFDTTNLPGRELPLVQHLAETLRAEGLSPEVLESGPERANLAVRLESDGSARPLLLLSHLDVVPAEPQHWTHPPFAAQLVDGYVWGRGAIDCKLTTAVQVQVLLMCRRLGLPMRRDLVLVAAADEELGGRYGVEWLVAQRPDLFDAEFGLNEGGGFAVEVDGRPLYTCQVGEKGGAYVDLVAHGRPGHSSVPHADNPIVHLGGVLEKLGGKLPHRVVASTRAFFESAAAAQRRPEVAKLLHGLLDPNRHEAALARVPADEANRLMFDAMLRNTCAPTILEAGVKRNVIPSTAKVELSGRPLPGADEATFLQEVRELVGDRVEFKMAKFRSGLEFPHQTPLFEAVTAAMRRWEPGAAVVPYMQTGGTDARFLGGRPMTVYGFVPMRREPGLHFFELCHGHDERVSTANILFAVQVLFTTACRLNGIEI